MKRGYLVLAVALMFTASLAAAPKPCTPTKPSLPAPTALGVASTDASVEAVWNEVEGATKYSVDVIAHYEAIADEAFGFTVLDDDVEVNTASISIPLAELSVETCDDFECTTTTTHAPLSVELKVKALNPPTPKGKDQAQCNPFTLSCVIDICGDGVDGDDDGAIDEDCDNDGDGYVTGDVDHAGCPPAGTDDCDDEDEEINPGAEDVCGDGIDQDCDGFDAVCEL